MTNEEFQQLVLEKLTNLEQGQKALQGDVGNIKATMATEEDIANLDTRLGFAEGQLTETNGIVKNLMHNSEVLNAKIEGLATSTAGKEFAKRTEKMLTLLNAKVATKEDVAEFRTHLIDEIDAVRTELKEDMKSIFEVMGEHEVKIRTMMRKPV